MNQALELALAALAACAAGCTNAIAGGGTLISFPALSAVGLGAVQANATSSVALLPGYYGGLLAQRQELRALQMPKRPQLIAAAIGGLTGSVLLLTTGETAFRSIVPFLILVACLLLGFQDRLRNWLNTGAERHDRLGWQVGAVGVASVYGGYFGAGLGIIFLAILGLFCELSLTKLNPFRQALSVAASTASVSLLVFSGRVEWRFVAVMAPASLIGGNVGGRLAGRVPATTLRSIVIAVGVIVATVYLINN